MKHIQKPHTFLWNVIKPYKYYYLMMSLMTLSLGIEHVLYNYAIKLLLDVFTYSEFIEYSGAIWPIFCFIMTHIIVQISRSCNNWADMKTMPYIGQRIMNSAAKHVFSLPYAYFQDNSASTIAAKMRALCDKYYKIHSLLVSGLSAQLLVIIFSLTAIFLINKSMFVLVAICLTILITYIAIFMSTLNKLEKDNQNSWYELFGFVSDCINNMANIVTFNAKSREINKISEYYDKKQNQLDVKYLEYTFVSSIFTGLIYTISHISSFVFIIYLKRINAITIGDTALIISSILWVYKCALYVVLQMRSLVENITAFQSAFTIMQVPICNIDKPNAIALQATNGEIIWKNVAFKYDNDKYVLQNFNLHITPGQKVGVVGLSGAGKSTLISLLLKNFQLTSGDIMIDNQSIYNCTSDSVRASISLVPQDTLLFHRSIGENIGYAKDNATQNEIEEAAKKAKLHDFIMSLPEKYDAMLGERGVKLSGGQRQRIGIARAIMRRAKILILDEATSSLDSVTEQEIQTSVNEMLENNKSTVIAIAHRLSTIKNMDRIIVLDNGQIVEDGSFDELIAANGHFQNLWDSQTKLMQ